MVLGGFSILSKQKIGFKSSLSNTKVWLNFDPTSKYRSRFWPVEAFAFRFWLTWEKTWPPLHETNKILNQLIQNNFCLTLFDKQRAPPPPGPPPPLGNKKQNYELPPPLDSTHAHLSLPHYDTICLTSMPPPPYINHYF